MGTAPAARRRAPAGGRGDDSPPGRCHRRTSYDVTFKERRRLVIRLRETPLNLAHIRNMAAVTEMGGIVYPPMPAFYGRAKTLPELIDETVGRILALFGIEDERLFEPWEGLGKSDRPR
ncbi:flavoprotein [Methylococcus sp. EFPC2]|uniref:flavoprotein n=1 Tax=Methylococcus sp. EFPC2 TaxID=2812648 RepID=UPI00353001EF